MLGRRSFVWCALQTPGQKWMSRRMCQSIVIFRNSQFVVTHDFKVSGHEEDDHQCAAVTHACGEVTIIFHFPQHIY